MKILKYGALGLTLFCFSDLFSAYNFYSMQNSFGPIQRPKLFCVEQQKKLSLINKKIEILHKPHMRNRFIDHVETLSHARSYALVMEVFGALFDKEKYDIVKWLVPIVKKELPSIDLKLMSLALHTSDLNGYKASLGVVTSFPMGLKDGLTECIKTYDPDIHQLGVKQLMSEYSRSLFFGTQRSSTSTYLAPQMLSPQKIAKAINLELYMLKHDLDTRCFVFEVNGTIVGFVTYRLSKDWTIDERFGINRCEILSIAVDEIFRQKHVATVLLQHLIKEMKKKNIKEIFVNPALNNVKGQRLYLKNGFDYTVFPLPCASIIRMKYMVD